MEHTVSTVKVKKPKEIHSAEPVIGVFALEKTLREKISEFTSTSFEVDGKKRKGSYRLLAEYTGISQSYIHQFHSDERAICITNMNKLANYFNVAYVVSNF